MPQLSSVACSILDARSSEQFIFVPDWMMKALRLQPRFAKQHPMCSIMRRIILRFQFLLAVHSRRFLEPTGGDVAMQEGASRESLKKYGVGVADSLCGDERSNAKALVRMTEYTQQDGFFFGFGFSCAGG